MRVTGKRHPPPPAVAAHPSCRAPFATRAASERRESGAPTACLRRLLQAHRAHLTVTFEGRSRTRFASVPPGWLQTQSELRTLEATAVCFYLSTQTPCELLGGRCDPPLFQAQCREMSVGPPNEEC